MSNITNIASITRPALAETGFVAGEINAKGIGCIIIDTSSFREISLVSNTF